ncbi:MAG: bifunctional heptose 7-phosphate kinase/heptose 1-phosphate adenyltransferase [Victivallaceae bacterium]
MEAERLAQIVDQFQSCRIAVIGDLMLDVYLWGKVTRISPEAPVPVVEIEHVNCCLGGAANVMRNLATLGGSALAFGLVGDDSDGVELRRQLVDYGISDRMIATDAGRRTTKKERVIAGSQQLMRLDHEDLYEASEELRETMVEEVLKLIRKRAVDAVIFEDYGKGMLSGGMLQTIVEEADRHGVITALDPKPGNLPPVRNLTIIKPNRLEAAAMAGLPPGLHDRLPPGEKLDRVAERLRELWNPRYLLISLAAEGMALYSREGGKSVIPTRAREVFDVSGAGDTVVAAFTLALAAGATPEEAAEIGNYAAGVVVGKVGTVTVSAEELKEELKSRSEV